MRETCAQHRPPQSRGCSDCKAGCPCQGAGCPSSPSPCLTAGLPLGSASARAQCSPGQTRESQPGYPFPVLLPAQPAPAGSLLPREEESCGEPCSGHAQQGQDSSPEGIALSAEAEAPVPVARTPRSLLEVFSPVPAAAAQAASPLPRCQPRPGGTSSGHLPPMSAWHRLPAVALHWWRKTRNRKTVKSLPQPSCCSPIIQSLRPSPCPERQANPGPTSDYTPPRPVACSSQSFSPRSPGAEVMGGCLQAGGCGSPAPTPACPRLAVTQLPFQKHKELLGGICAEQHGRKTNLLLNFAR